MNKTKIYIITDSTGFPNGTATAKRILTIGKCLVEGGNEVFLYTNFFSKNDFNNQTDGVYEGIHFSYLHGNVKSNLSKIIKLPLYFLGLVKIFFLATKIDKQNSIVYIYSHGTLFNFYTIYVAKLFKLKIIQEINEWFHHEVRKPFQIAITEGPMIKKADGAIVISKSIQKNAININPRLKTIIVPVLEIPKDYSLYAKTKDELSNRPYCFWMGLVDGYLTDVLFILESLAVLYKENGLLIDFVVSGPYLDSSYEKIKLTATRLGYPVEHVKLLGFVNNEDLNKYCFCATFYVIPLWKDSRSENRFPSKVATFMFMGNPIITCKIGEMGDLFEDGENILFFESGSREHLAAQMNRLCQDSALLEKIKKQSRLFAYSYFDYGAYNKKISEFVKSVLEQ